MFNFFLSNVLKIGGKWYFVDKTGGNKNKSLLANKIIRFRVVALP
jgi:hypothetical protein